MTLNNEIYNFPTLYIEAWKQYFKLARTLLKRIVPHIRLSSKRRVTYNSMNGKSVY